MTNRAQSGRSMMEMLMMLAMIGVLSMITFFGYEMAMAKYRANSIIKETNQMAFEIEQQFENEAPVLDLSEYQPDDCDWCDEAAEGEHNIRLAGYDVTVTEDEATTAFLVSFMDVDQKVCEKLINTGWSDPYAIFVNDYPVPSALAICGANNQIDVAFNNTLDTKAPDCNPGYGWNEENQKCEQCEEGYYHRNNECHECPDGATSAAGATECLCPDGSLWNNSTGTCDLCPADTYQRGNMCKQCPPGATSPAGSTVCTCPQEPGWNEEDEECVPRSCLSYSDCGETCAECVKPDGASASTPGYCKTCAFVDYIQSSGGAYIDTKYAFSDNYSFEVEFKDAKTAASVFGARNGDIRSGLIYRSNSGYYVTIGNQNSNSTPFSLGALSGSGWIKIKAAFKGQKGSVWVGDSQVYTSKDFTGSYICGLSPYVFTSNNSGSHYEDSNVKVHTVKMWQGSELKRDLEAAYVNGEGGVMYDHVSHKLFYNEGGGSLSAP